MPFRFRTDLEHNILTRYVLELYNDTKENVMRTLGRRIKRERCI